ncbi:cob(I)yrinic acid a,c-diamide adenosyltransferase [Halothiobacillus sp. DCM-1]|uniref:cob(I)yrinic acid a,c-diamide adenosyltransferase n=1 Tax=Halothiobacillus sp. DCM-1 TaxID=3112558 RepID=UPI00324FECA2
MSEAEKNRLSRIVTRTGDGGQTGLADGRRCAKSDPCIVALGDIDELNAACGLLHAQMMQAPGMEAALVAFVRAQQHALFDLGGFLAMGALATADQLPSVEALDDWIARHNAELPPLKEFILPGGSLVLGQAHVARTVARRAERSLWLLVEQMPSVSPVAVYLNRLSDALFVLARRIGTAEGSLVYWQKNHAARSTHE